ncbi:MKI67 FHA domain-interacting nucleolar phosphoprotein-like [Oopsacas minuta]|uniref:MKI67 FHA domain-interacting nucleolar phosphoprotein-like n=1 Tax=Oopsacas minuta TaxID=111878 RepID=A0AAV7JH76_9METZ|nr:MKI67 FHA domain-interacting nucleolar phosphoprotein-like [Oopsacas minuta]
MDTSPSDLSRQLLERKQLLLSKRANIRNKAYTDNNTCPTDGHISTAAANDTKRIKRSNRDKKLAKKESKRRKQDLEDVVTRPGIIYLGHIPHGFYEQEMRQYFSQFGRVQSVRLSRCYRTGRSRGYAFVKFQCDEVAKLAAETMNNYLMYSRLLKCQVVSGHKNMFKRSRHWKSQTEREEAMRQRYNTLQSVGNDQAYRKRIKNIVRRENKLKRKLKEGGYLFECASVSQLISSKKLGVIPSHKKFYNPDSDKSDSEFEI